MKRRIKKPKIEFGQCYLYHDHVYMIIRSHLLEKGFIHWQVQDTLAKIIDVWPESFIRELSRAFDNNW